MKVAVRQLMKLPDRFLFGWSDGKQRSSFEGARQAKHFVVELIEAQAMLDHITLSNVEQRRLWFSEADQPGLASADLEDEESFETKVRGLTTRLMKRLKAENGEQYELWTMALKTLRAGDHYLVVLTDVNDDQDRPPHDRLKLWLMALVIVVVFTFGAMWLSTTFHFAFTKEEGGIVAWVIATIVILVAYSARLARWIGRKSGNSRRRFED